MSSVREKVWLFEGNYGGTDVRGVGVTEFEAKEKAYKKSLSQIIISEYENWKKEVAASDSKLKGRTWEKCLRDDLGDDITNYRLDIEYLGRSRDVETNSYWHSYRAYFDNIEVAKTSNKDQLTAKDLAFKDARGGIYVLWMMVDGRVVF
ncbi:hypothetical protein EW145_g1595 [Phellinidium pouzarii]|uniref:Uncharacterized protein n=1 Tax=Phellinidium pouzarii TaxID=167371 RepID=A0A4S4LEF5_9AGAM|nr:hypothetical protein EW145_g1595 [Phellinidium pouzarii]